MSQDPVYVSLEFTPNPNTLKYSVNRQILPAGALNILSAEDAEKTSPLAVKLFAITGINGIMLGMNFVTITKSEEGDWDSVHEQVSKIIDDHLSRDEVVVYPDALSAQTSAHGTTSTEKKIIEILDNEIRPAVAQDGGDITFDRYQDGIVYLYLQGSCAGCPSATATLKMGIEKRLKEVVPEIKEVMSI